SSVPSANSAVNLLFQELGIMQCSLETTQW
ncbi:MAG: hypothetical protein ACI9X0_002680, partial [Kiritimatiellia bacterium]